MAIEDIEGNHRLEARRRPPGPPVFGLDGQPTLVHTPRTMAHLAISLREGAPGTRVVTVEGDVDATATLELPESATLDDAIDAVGVDGQFKAACVGGRFGGVTDSLATALDPDSLTAAGLGTDGIVHVLSADQCLLSFIGKRASFGADTNCGRCVPCREGTTQLTELLRDVYDGQYDRATIDELTDVMATTSLCAFGVAAARPVETALATFEREIEAHADGRCPAGTCSDPMEAR
jgi:NADH-quinone oxidoreductase subunit F